MKAAIQKKPASSEQSRLESKEEKDKKETPKIPVLPIDLKQLSAMKTAILKKLKGINLNYNLSLQVI